MQFLITGPRLCLAGALVCSSGSEPSRPEGMSGSWQVTVAPFD